MQIANAIVAVYIHPSIHPSQTSQPGPFVDP